MSEQRIRPYRCTCTECQPLPPIDNLHPDSFEERPTAAKMKGLIETLTERLRPARKAS